MKIFTAADKHKPDHRIERCGSLLWEVTGKIRRPLDPEAYQAWLKGGRREENNP